jgi:hypothetical protein
MSDDFDWHAATADGDVVVPDQAAIACYTNPFGNVVLRQEGRYPEEDIWIVCQPIYVEALAIALLRAAGLTDLVIVPVSQIEIVRKDGEERQNQKDWTAAERKHRQRQRERDGKSNADESVTPAGPVTVTPESVTGRAKAKAEAPPTAPVTELNGAPSKQSTPQTEPPEQKPPAAVPKAAEPVTSGLRMTRADFLRQQELKRQEEEAAVARLKQSQLPERAAAGAELNGAKASVVSIQPRLFEEESEPQAHAR